MEKIVKGATKIKLAAPKSKYIESILSSTQGGESGVAEVFRTLQLRLRDSTWTIVFKSLIVVHLMIREGAPEATLRYIAESPKRLAISSFAEAQTQGVNIRRYYEYLSERVRAYRETKVDFVRSGVGKMRQLTVDRGLLRQTEAVQDQIRALVRCDFMGNADPDNEISLTAFRLCTMDVLELFKVMNEATINVLEHYFEMSRPDAERALNIYKTFGKQTDQVVQYLSLARQYEASTRLEVPKLKHAPTTLTASLEEYLNDPDFEVNRRQYLAQQEAKRTGKPVAAVSKPAASASQPQKSTATASVSAAAAPPPQQKGPAPDLIDFFESIEQNQQTMASPQQQQQPFNTGFVPNQQFQQFQQVPQATGYNPFLQQQAQPQPQQQQPQPLQPNFTGAGFGGYGPQPQQNQPTQQPFQFSSLSSIPQNGVADFNQQPQQQQQQQQIQSPVGQLQPQHTSTNPFRQSMMATGSVVSPTSPMSRQSTNPFAPANNVTSPVSPIQGGTNGPQTQFDQLTQSSAFFQQTTSPPPQQTQSPAPLQQQRTGTNPFAKSLSPPPAQPLAANVTGTNPFRQSQFVNQSTGMGWQHSTQGTFGGFDVNNVPTQQIFPRPGANGS